MDGLGWDGTDFAKVTKNFETYLLNNKIDKYRIQRIFSFGICYYTLKLLSIEISNQSIVNFFIFVNAGLILFSYYFYLKISETLKFNLKTYTIGFSCLFINFSLLKMPFYNPVLTDTFAFFISIALIYFYIRNVKIGLYIGALMGAFTFPTLLYVGIILILFPKGYKYKLQFKSGKRLSQNNCLPYNNFPYKIISYINSALPYILTVGYLLVIIYMLVNKLYIIPKKDFSINPVNTYLLPISILTCLFYLFLISKNILSTNIWNSLKKTNILNIGLIISLLLFQQIIINLFSNGKTFFSFATFIRNILLQSITNPLIFLVSHFIYFGPTILLCIYFFPQLKLSAGNLGLGYFIILAIFLILAIGSESRQFINAFPFFVIALCNFLNTLPLKNWHVAILFITSLIMSKFWYPINYQKFSGRLIDFPYQNYFMNHGPWISNSMYLINSAICIIAFISMYFLINKNEIKSKS